MEEALYEITPMSQFAHLTLSPPIPEDTTIMNFRHRSEKQQLAPAILVVINDYLPNAVCRVSSRLVADARQVNRSIPRVK